MIKFDGRVANVLSKHYYDDLSTWHQETTMLEWLSNQSKELGIKRIYRFEYILVFESPEDEIVFRLRFGI